MIIDIDGRDAAGRRYFLVDVFPNGPLKRAFEAADPDHCVECGAAIRHGWDRYYQRNEATDGLQADPLEATLMTLTYDAVCGPCGDAAITAPPVGVKH